MRCAEAIHPHCPKCGRVARVLVWAVDAQTGARTYKCVDCGATWGVEGTQVELFADAAAVWELKP